MALTRTRSLTLIGALSGHVLGPCKYLTGALTQRHFAWYVARRLAPTRQSCNVLVLHNALVHKLVGMGEWLAERGGELLFLPPYSPDFSPVERAWSKLKTKLRTALEQTL